MYDWLTWTNPEGQSVPGVAEKWEMSSDAKSWSLTIRGGMRFHNGDPVTAADVIFSFQQMLADAEDPQHATNAPLWTANVASAEASSPQVARVNLKQPWPTMIPTINVLSGSEGAVIPAAYFSQVGAKGFDERPVGSGPWQMVRHQPGISFMFRAVPGPHAYRQTPRYREMEMLAVQEESTRLALLRTGVADLIEIGSFDVAVAAQKAGQIRLASVPGLITGGVIIYGTDDPRAQSLPTARKEVREAMALAINVREIVDTVFAGQARPAVRYNIGPVTMGFDPTWKPTSYDPDRARQLLSRAGYANGFSFTVYRFAGGTTPWLPVMMDAVVGYWNNVGLRPTVRPVDMAVVSQMYRARPQSADLIGQVSPLWSVNRPVNLPGLRTYFHCKGTTLVLCRPGLDTLIDEAFAETNPNQLVALTRRIMDTAHSEYVALPIAEMPTLVGVGARVESWTPIPGTGLGPALETVVPKR